MITYIYHSHGDKDRAMDLKYVLYINLSRTLFENKCFPLQEKRCFKLREGGDIGLFITLVPKVGFKTLGTYIDFGLVGTLSSISKCFNH